MIKGNKREQTEFKEKKKFIGLVECKVVAINPDEEQYAEITGNKVKEDSKQFNYLGEDEEGNKQLRIDVWFRDVKNEENTFKTSFFLKNVIRKNKDETKTQYINQTGTTSWSESENKLIDWFKKTDYRESHIGEEELYNFLKSWLSGLDYKDVDTVLDMDWSKLMKGNIKEMRQQIDGEYCGNILILVGIKTVEKEGEIKTYQSVFNKAFTYPAALKQFRSVNYDDSSIITRLKSKLPKELKAYEKFALAVKGEYGFKDVHILKDLKEFNENDFLVTSDKTISEEDTEY
jgi:hypothetical protein